MSGFFELSSNLVNPRAGIDPTTLYRGFPGYLRKRDDTMALNTSSLFLCGLAVPALVCAMPIEAAAAAVPTVGVSGTGEVSVKPDRATVRIGASHQADTAIEAQSRVNEIIDEATKAIRALDIEGLVIQTSGLSLSAVYDYRRDQEPRIIGYRSSISLSVRIDDIDRTGRVIDAAMSTGANQLQGVEFSLQDDGEARREALKRAVHDARSKADAIADALGRSLVGLVEVREQGVSVPVLRRGAESGEMMRMSADAAPTPIEAGEISVRANVEITYSLGSGN